MSDIEKTRQESEGKEVVMRSCWKCNPAHEHLKKEDQVVIVCFVCGRFYFKGVDITIDDGS